MAELHQEYFLIVGLVQWTKLALSSYKRPMDYVVF